MSVKFSEDVIRLSDLKVNPGKVVGRAQDTHRPILIPSRSRRTIVVLGLEDYERTTWELGYVKAVAQGLMDARQGNILSLKEARQRLGVQ